MHEHVENVVVGFDFSPASKAALEAAALLVRNKQRGRVRTVTALRGAARAAINGIVHEHDPSPAASEPDDALEAHLEDVRGHVHEAAEEIETWDVPLAFAVVPDRPARAILGNAREYGADLIVVGAYGQNAPKRGREVGIDAERLARKSPFPVLVVDPSHAFPPKKVLCPVDFSEASAGALKYGLELAQSSGAECVLLHVAERPEIAEALNDSVGRLDEALLLDAANERLAEFLEEHHIHDIDLPARLTVGNPAQVILEVATNESFDLIAIGTLGRSALIELLIGGTADRVIRHAPCSIVTVKPARYALKKVLHSGARGM